VLFRSPLAAQDGTGKQAAIANVVISGLRVWFIAYARFVGCFARYNSHGDNVQHSARVSAILDRVPSWFKEQVKPVAFASYASLLNFMLSLVVLVIAFKLSISATVADSLLLVFTLPILLFTAALGLLQLFL
jgi:hypothetical protein